MLIDGYAERVEISRKRDAWMLANLLSPHTKEKLKPGMFLGEAQTTDWKRISEEEYQQILARKRAG